MVDLKYPQLGIHGSDRKRVVPCTGLVEFFA